MLTLKKSETRFSNAERILTALAALLAMAVTLFACQFLTPDIDNPLTLLGSALVALAIFVNAFGAAVLLLLVPLEFVAHRNRHA